MGLWGRLARAFEEAERILLEADLGVAATMDLVVQVARAPQAGRLASLERAVVALLAGDGDPGPPARAAKPRR